MTSIRAAFGEHMYAPDAGLLTEPLPTQLWIELSSRCPFDCVFCSRKLRRGQGQHLDFALYRSLLAQLEYPEVIRLNYAGESIHYPRLLEAIALAKGSGARTELVTAFATISPALLAGLARSGLDRLTVSLHTLDRQQFREIYGLSSLEELTGRVEAFRRLARECPAPPELDFAFVAMERNLGQLEPLAAYAEALGVGQIQVCPVIRRDPIPETFAGELRGEHGLTAPFRARLRRETEGVRRRHPQVRIALANPEVEADGAVPEPTRIRSCEQNPWTTAHVLASGDLVACEVHDGLPLGNLAWRRLRDIWQGPDYGEFRRRYLAGGWPECRRCPWRVVVKGEPLRSTIVAQDGGSSQLLAGWHAGPDPGVVWSKPESAAILARPAGARRLRVRGLLPPGSEALEIFVNGKRAGQVDHSGTELLGFERVLRVRRTSEDSWRVSFRTRGAYCPAREQAGGDPRRLGFALLEMAAEPPPRWWRRLLRSSAALPLAALALADAVCRRVRRWAPRRLAPPRPFHPGLSVVIPERDNPALLERCLASLAAAAKGLAEPCEVAVVVNGTPPERYARLRERHPHLRWLWCEEPLGFSGAVRAGLRLAAFDWVYLLNNDMVLEPDALRKLLPLRAADVFAIASQILPESAEGRREESNWTGWRFRGGLVEIYDAPPRDDREAYASLYAGGGSSLFRRELLERLVARAGGAYEPFYWEDVEWGVVARKLGYRVLFCPGSRAVHARRATISRHYAPEEIERIFERNRCRFQLRNVTARGSLAALARRILAADRRTLFELLEPVGFLRAAAARIRSHFLPLDDRQLEGARRAEDGCTISP